MMGGHGLDALFKHIFGSNDKIAMYMYKLHI